MDIQRKYWKTMVNLKAAIFYLNVYADRSYKNERRINMFLAIVSFSSIGGWAIWQELSFVWALIIAASQVVTAIKPYLPFCKRLEIIQPFEYDLSRLFNEADYNWFKVSNGDLIRNEINDLIAGLSREYTEIKNKHLTCNDLLENESIKKIADEKATVYFDVNYHA